MRISARLDETLIDAACLNPSIDSQQANGNTSCTNNPTRSTREEDLYAKLPRKSQQYGLVPYAAR
ncbi:hypothetical protein sscle_16g110220 [Sclerotinia sclerotiorum 1980 UF-70]|uniref:Uncharacterized protein n=1 Tax=Sclerotinia sclerotiorum (strain ATCC 18683 / 1980 / Ss-1) TaxID=665079 RepID=A0A1D9QN55_SCLS1|nr:hypothetical protein sscle_16g110220 [Sclerotinia sclerotiorum 1980 UF-70]